MMPLRTEFKISFFCWILWFVAWMNHSLKPVLFLFSLMMTHEAAHCLAAKMMKIPVSKVTIYPFGLCAVMNTLGFQTITVQMIVLSMGILVHCGTFFVLELLIRVELISMVFFHWCWNMNLQLLIFNCLPIFPLDGSSILRVLFCAFFPYHRALQFQLWVSVFVLVSFFLFYFPVTPASIMVFLGLLILNMNEFRSLSNRVHDARLYQLRSLDEKKDFYLYKHD